MVLCNSQKAHFIISIFLASPQPLSKVEMSRARNLLLVIYIYFKIIYNFTPSLLGRAGVGLKQTTPQLNQSILFQ